MLRGRFRSCFTCFTVMLVFGIYQGTLVHVRGQTAKSAIGARTIDGAQTPELIPDETAWLMLFTTIGDGPKAPEYKVRASMVGSAGFAETDTQSVIAAATEAMARIRAMELPILNSSASMDSKTQVLRFRRDEILRDVVSKLLSRLSPDFGAKFQAHIKGSVKTHIRITP